ncbi:MAG: EF-P lysine aminoacylase EpmA, partial [Pseudomonadota bacterium]
MIDAAAPRAWRPAADRRALRARADLYSSLRQFFAERDVLEVHTPVLSRAGTTDPALAPLRTRCNGLDVWLHTSPEFAMKRLLAASSGDIFQVCSVFRDDESGRHHNPEFTMLEWYRLGFDHHALMDEVEALVRTVLPAADAPGPMRRVTFHAALADGVGVNADTAGPPQLRAALLEAGVPWPEALHEDREALLDLLLGEVLSKHFARDGGLVCVYDYPPQRAALARVRPGPPARAERFEVYLDGIELANGFHELTDAREQRERFDTEAQARHEGGLAPVPRDDALLAAL